MLTIILDSKSPLRVNWSKKPGDVLALGRAYLAQEESLAAEARLPLPALAHVQTQTDALAAAIAAYETARVGRDVSSESRQQALAEARPLVAQARDMLVVYYADNLRRIGEWGFQTRERGDQVSVLLPKSKAALVATLAAYVAQEQSLPEAERLPRPPLARLVELNAIVQSDDEAVRLQRAAREAKRQERDRLAAELHTTLQVALVNLVYGNDSRLDNRFQEWGYDLSTPGGQTASPGDPPAGGGATG